jgi:hypothetical protein
VVEEEMLQRYRPEMKEVKVEGGRVADGGSRQAIVISEFPIVIVKVSELACSVIISFFQPEVNPTNDLTFAPTSLNIPKYLEVSTITYDKTQDKIDFIVDPVNPSNMYLQIGKSIYSVEFLQMK